MLDKPQAMRFCEPQPDGSATLEHCIRLRRSVREYCDQALSVRELGQLLWAAQGMTSADAGRTVPSAGALSPLEVYVVSGKVSGLAVGMYRYNPLHHELLPIAGGYQREKPAEAARSQDWIASAPAVICGRTFFYVPDVANVRNMARTLGGIDIYISDGATMERSMVREKGNVPIGLASIVAQPGWCAKAGVPRAIFTHCGSGDRPS